MASMAIFDAQPARKRAIALLDADPDLGEGMEPDRRAAARDHALAALLTVEPGHWDARALSSALGAHGLGLFVVDGLLTRDIAVTSTAFTELIGPGEILRPWPMNTDAERSVTVDWKVLSTTSVAVLDRRFTQRTAPWPELTAAILGRAVRRSHFLAVQLAICHLKRIETRLLLLLWHLAERWGRVTSDGVVIKLGLTHQMLASLVGARRPTVTTALREMATRDEVVRRDDGYWLLRGDPPPELTHLYASMA